MSPSTDGEEGRGKKMVVAHLSRRPFQNWGKLDASGETVWIPLIITLFLRPHRSSAEFAEAAGFEQ